MLAGAGADFLTVPSAFTRPTGAAHWHVLLRSRAIETGCFVFAPAQSGEHENGRETFGHSLIIDPWGEVLADAGLEPGVIYADIKKERVTKARQQIPSLQHGRGFHLPDDKA
jgi:predicted amidohydrolase